MIVYGTDAPDHLLGTDNNDTIHGLGGKDAVYGSGGNDYIYVGTGNDYVDGGSGNDVLKGEGQNDTLVGGMGKDTLTGGKGADHFVFSNGDTGDGTTNADVISDFKRSEGDKIDLSLTDVNQFGGKEGAPEANEVSYWFSDNNTVVSFNDGGTLHNIVLSNLHMDMVANDFIIG